MKKRIYLAIFSVMLFSACSSTGPYFNEDMPADLQAFHEEQLNEHLDLLEEDDSNVESLLEVAYRYEALGNYDKAIKYYEMLLAIDASHQPALNNLASIYEEMENYELAATYISDLYLVKPSSTEVIKDTVRILLLNENPEGAYLVMDHYREQTADDEVAQAIAAELQEDINDYMNAKHGLE